jgi:FkbM family methyltransferase
MQNNFDDTLKGIVCHKGIYWPIKDLGGDITKDFAPQSSTCYQLMVNYPDVPYNISKFVKNKDVVLQAGGNVGFYVKKYANVFNTVYTFEPEPLSFKCLNLNITNPNVFKFQACLGDTHECVNLFNACDTLGHGGSHVTGKGGLTPTFLIDDLNLTVCNLIHLDIEGYEKKALTGGIETIKRCRPVIVIENYPPWAQRYGTNLGEIESLLLSLDYKYVSEVQGDRVYTPIDY